MYEGVDGRHGAVSRIDGGRRGERRGSRARRARPLSPTESVHQITIDKDTMPLAAFCTPTQLFGWLTHSTAVARVPCPLPARSTSCGRSVSLPLGAGAVPGMLGGMGMGMGDKTVRELFVGNTPQGTSDFVLLEFLNAAMKQVSLGLLFLFFFRLTDWWNGSRSRVRCVGL